MNAREKAEHFRSLHIPGNPLVLFNIWDPGSAKAVVAAGANALATGSWSVANANGYTDGEKTPFDLVIGNLSRIVQAVEVPVTVDVESGYGKTPAEVGEAIAKTVQAGAVGCNLEDSYPETGKLRSVAEQVHRIQQARKAADQSNPAYFINARTDVFFQPTWQENAEAAIADTLERARAYAEAGANGLFAPGLSDEALIAKLTAASPLPVNIMVDEATPTLGRLAQLGVARVSHGPRPYLTVMKALEAAARAAIAKA